MNILEVSFLVADLTIFFGAIVSYSRFRRLKKQVDVLQTKLDSFQDNIYQLQTYQRYELKFELDEIRNQQEQSQVTISKLGMDLKSIRNQQEKSQVTISKLGMDLNSIGGERGVYSEQLDILNRIEILRNKFGDKSKNTKPTDSIENEVVQIIKDEQKALDLTNEEPQEELILIRRKPKSDAKRVITTRELEQYFKEVTKLTYRGYVLKYGQVVFQSMKKKVYKKLYYQKFTKPTPTPTRLQSQLPLMA